MARSFSHPDQVALQSEAVPVQFAGFYSDTAELGRHGWRLALEESGHDHYRGGPRHMAILHHRDTELTMVGQFHGADELRRQRNGMFGHFRGHGTASWHNFRHAYEEGRYAGEPYIQIQQAGSKGRMQVMTLPTLDRMTWRDPELRHTEVATMRELHEMPLFAQPYPDTQELIVEPQSVQALMEQILAQQGTMRKEIRTRDRQRERADGTRQARQVHAQIVSLAA